MTEEAESESAEDVGGSYSGASAGFYPGARTEARVGTRTVARHGGVPIARTFEFRTWTSSGGDFHIEATFVSATAGKVKLRKADGTIITVDLSKLSEEDQAYVRALGR